MKPEKLLLIDCETTGVKPESDQLCEVGAILFSIEHRAVIQQLSFLLPVAENPAYSVNKIKPEITQAEISPSGYAPWLLIDMINAADAFVAHNADFDRPWVTDFAGTLDRASLVTTKPWICTCYGISWPGLKPGASLASLALSFGVPVWAAHRALTDCTYLAHIFERDENLEQHVQEGLLPQVLYQACVSFEEKELAKEAGFRWMPERRQWLRKCNKLQVSNLPFLVREVNA